MDNVTKAALRNINMQLSEQIDAINKIYNMVKYKAETSDLNIAIVDLKDDIKTLGNLLNMFEKKLSIVKLPEETKFYMEQSQFDQIEKNVQENQSLLVEIHKMRRSVLTIINSLNN